MFGQRTAVIRKQNGVYEYFIPEPDRCEVNECIDSYRLLTTALGLHLVGWR